MIPHHHTSIFDNHPATLKEQLEQLGSSVPGTTDKERRAIEEYKLLEEKTVLVFQPRLIRFANIDWSTLNGEEDLITINSSDGKPVTVIYSSMTLLE